jgi:hypothetical protein
MGMHARMQDWAAVKSQRAAARNGLHPDAHLLLSAGFQMTKTARDATLHWRE